jgi:hypothetical protein
VDDSRLLLAEWLGAIRGEVEATTTGRDRLRSLSLVWPSIEALEARRWVALHDFYEKLRILSIV